MFPFLQLIIWDFCKGMSLNQVMHGRRGVSIGAVVAGETYSFNRQRPSRLLQSIFSDEAWSRSLVVTDEEYGFEDVVSLVTRYSCYFYDDCDGDEKTCQDDSSGDDGSMMTS
jgi:hypothetical protein